MHFTQICSVSSTGGASNSVSILICPGESSGPGSGVYFGRETVRRDRGSAGTTREEGSFTFRFLPSFSRVSAVTSSQMKGVQAAAIRIHQPGA